MFTYDRVGLRWQIWSWHQFCQPPIWEVEGHGELCCISSVYLQAVQQQSLLTSADRCLPCENEHARLQGTSVRSRLFHFQAPAGQPNSPASEPEGEGQFVQGTGLSQSAVGLRMENAVLRAEVAELYARECLQRLETPGADRGTRQAAKGQASSGRRVCPLWCWSCGRVHAMGLVTAIWHLARVSPSSMP